MLSVHPSLRMGLALALAALDAPPLSDKERAAHKSKVADEYARHRLPAMQAQGQLFTTTMKEKA